MGAAVEPYPNFLVCPVLYSLGHHPDLGVHDQLEFGAPFRGGWGVIERYGVVDGKLPPILLDYVGTPLVKLFSNGGAGEYSKKMAPTKRGDTATPINYFLRRVISTLCRDFNYLRRIWRRFIGITATDT